MNNVKQKDFMKYRIRNKFYRLGKNGFSLIELIGVLAVIAIAALVLIPNLIKRIDESTANTEAKNLKLMADSFKLFIKRNWYIPTYTNWADAVALQIGWEKGDILTNDRGIARAFLIDPNLRIAGSQLPYNQKVVGSTNKPVSPRLMIVSSLFSPLPISSGVVVLSNDFNAIWNTPEGSVPSIWNTWQGNNYGNLLKIQRINLEPMFKYVALNKSQNFNPGFGIGTNYDLTGVDKAYLTGPTFGTYYLESTILYLYRTNGALDLRQIVSGDLSLNFANNIWGGQPVMGVQITGQDFQNCADFFMTARLNSNAKNGATPQTVLTALTDFLDTYVAWANTGFDKKSPLFTTLKDKQNSLGNQTEWLIFKPKQ